PGLGATNQCLQINSGANANEWYVGPLSLDELAVGARFRLVAFTATGKENLLCLTTHSDDNLVFDGAAPLVNPYDGYIEWGSGALHYDATTTTDFDWVAYGNHF